MKTLVLAARTVLFLWTSILCAQDAVPKEILDRTTYIQAGNEQGTAFKIDYKGKLYYVTAKHMVRDLPSEKPLIKFRQGSEWIDLHILKILYPPRGNADIAVLATGEAVARPFQMPVASPSDGVTFGQQVWFLGYPLIDAIHTKLANNYEAPFIKRGTVSAIDSSDPNSIVIYIDGFNNRGFSGGPIIFWGFSLHDYRILSVVSGYRNAQAEADVNGQRVDTNILVNSGILVSYSIDHAIQAIESETESH